MRGHRDVFAKQVVGASVWDGIDIRQKLAAPNLRTSRLLHSTLRTAAPPPRTLPSPLNSHSRPSDKRLLGVTDEIDRETRWQPQLTVADGVPKVPEGLAEWLDTVVVVGM